MKMQLDPERMSAAVAGAAGALMGELVMVWAAVLLAPDWPTRARLVRMGVRTALSMLAGGLSAYFVAVWLARTLGWTAEGDLTLMGFLVGTGVLKLTPLALDAIEKKGRKLLGLDEAPK